VYIESKIHVLLLKEMRHLFRCFSSRNTGGWFVQVKPCSDYRFIAHFYKQQAFRTTNTLSLFHITFIYTSVRYTKYSTKGNLIQNDKHCSDK